MSIKIATPLSRRMSRRNILYDSEDKFIISRRVIIYSKIFQIVDSRAFHFFFFFVLYFVYVFLAKNISHEFYFNYRYTINSPLNRARAVLFSLREPSTSRELYFLESFGGYNILFVSRNFSHLYAAPLSCFWNVRVTLIARIKTKTSLPRLSVSLSLVTHYLLFFFFF